MLRVSILWAALALAGAAPSGAAQGAVALSLPKESVSLWRIGSESAYGLDFDASFRRSAREDESIHHRHFSFSLTRQSPPSSDRKVELLRYSRIGVHHAGGSHEREQTFWAVSATTGLGVSWRPFERVGLWVKSGAGVYYRRVESGRTEMRISIYSTPQVMAFFLF